MINFTAVFSPIGLTNRPPGLNGWVLCVGLILACSSTPCSGQLDKRIRERAKELINAGNDKDMLVYLDSISDLTGSDGPHFAALYRVECDRRSGSLESALAGMRTIEDDRPNAGLWARLTHAELRSLLLNSAGLKPDALQEALAALRIAEVLNDTLTIIDIGAWVAQLETESGRPDEALRRLIGLERQARSAHAGTAWCDVLLAMGNVHWSARDHMEASAAYEAAISCAHEYASPYTSQNARFNLGSCLMESEQLEKAEVTYKELLNELDAEVDPQFVADVHAQLGHLNNRRSTFKEALTELALAMDFLAKAGVKRGQAECLLFMSTAYLGLDDHPMALACADSALRISQEQHMLDRMEQSELRLADILERGGDHTGALEHLRAAKLLGDSLARKLYDDESNRMKLAFDTEKKEQEIQRQAQEARVRNAQLLGAVIAGVLLIVLSAALYRNLLHRKRLASKERELYEQRMGDVMRQSEIRSLDAVMQGQEMERKRVAKDLHDRLGSMLSAIKLQFSVLEGKVEKAQEENQQQYEHVTAMLDDAVGEVRRISHNMLKSSLAQFGLKGALDDLANALSTPGKLDVEMSLFGLEERMDQQVEIAVFRMIQECVGNALKHAKADAISIDVTRSPGALNVMVTDNGRGFDPLKVNEGMGLGNLRQRAAEVNGAVLFDSRPGHGTTVTIDVPLT